VSDERALAWTHLLPHDVAYQPVGGPEWWQEALRARSCPGGKPVMVLWTSTTAAGFDPAAAAGLVAVNPPLQMVRALKAAGFARIRQFAVLPGIHDPRWFVPLASRRIAAAAFQLYTAFRPRARVQASAVRLVARIGLPIWQRDVLIVASRAPALVEELLASAVPGPSAAVAMSTGTPGPARKVTLASFDSAGRMLAIAKVGTTPLASQLLAQEAAFLRALAYREDLARHCPRLLAEQATSTERIIVQEALLGRRVGPALTSAHGALLAALASGPPQPATASSLLTSLPARLAGVPCQAAVRLHNWANQALQEAWLPRTVVHGDFAPWNLRYRHRTLVAFDWEYARCDGLPLLDELHHHLQVGLLLRGWTASQALAELGRPASPDRYGLEQKQSRALQVIYLLDMLARRHEEGYRPEDRLFRTYTEMLERLATRLEARAA